jgi:hypothetical protein
MRVLANVARVLAAIVALFISYLAAGDLYLTGLPTASH